MTLYTKAHIVLTIRKGLRAMPFYSRMSPCTEERTQVPSIPLIQSTPPPKDGIPVKNPKHAQCFVMTLRACVGLFGLSNC